MNPKKVALRKESVDRNVKIMSVSNGLKVALRKESVDRNMPRNNLINSVCLVALRKESVDRNLVYSIALASIRGRSPQGERG